MLKFTFITLNTNFFLDFTMGVNINHELKHSAVGATPPNYVFHNHFTFGINPNHFTVGLISWSELTKLHWRWKTRLVHGRSKPKLFHGWGEPDHFLVGVKQNYFIRLGWTRSFLGRSKPKLSHGRSILNHFMVGVNPNYFKVGII